MNDETHPVSMIIYLNLIECLVCIDVIMVMECYGGCGMLQKGNPRPLSLHAYIVRKADHDRSLNLTFVNYGKGVLWLCKRDSPTFCGCLHA